MSTTFTRPQVARVISHVLARRPDTRIDQITPPIVEPPPPGPQPPVIGLTITCNGVFIAENVTQLDFIGNIDVQAVSAHRVAIAAEEQEVDGGPIDPIGPDPTPPIVEPPPVEITPPIYYPPEITPYRPSLAIPRRPLT
jgi:hypothetical protein